MAITERTPRRSPRDEHEHGHGPGPADGRGEGPGGGRRRAEVVVVGGGVAGLTAAATASRAGRSVLLVPGPAPAGRAATDERDGFLLNRGPHALYRGGAGAAVLRQLGIGLDGVTPPTGGLVLRRGAALPAPTGPISAVRTPLVSTGGKRRLAAFLLRTARIDPATLADRTVDEWLTGQLRDDDADVARMVVRVATYTASPEVVSADVAATQLKAALRGVHYLHGGWRQLTDRLAAAGHADVVPGRASSVRRAAGSHLVEIETTAGTFLADAVVVAPGTPEATAALLPTRPGWPALGPAVTASVLDLGLRRPAPRSVVVGIEEPLYCVAHAPRARLAPPGAGLLHAMRNHRAGEDPDPSATRRSLRELAGRTGAAQDDVVLERYLHRMVVVSAAPTPATGGLAGRPAIDGSGQPGVFLAGDWVGPDGFLADASLASGAAAGRAAVAWAASTATTAGAAGGRLHVTTAAAGGVPARLDDGGRG